MKVVRFAFLLVFLSGCIDNYSPELGANSQEQKLIVDAILSNDLDFTRVLLKKSKQVSSSDLIEGVDGAKVEILNDKDEQFKMTQNGGGRYSFISSDFQPKVGVSYRLSIELDNGLKYISEPQELLAPIPINTVSVKFENALTDIYGQMRNIQYVSIYENNTTIPSDVEVAYFWHDYFGKIGFRAPYEGSDICMPNGTRVLEQVDDVICYKDAQTFLPTNTFSIERATNTSANKLLFIHPDYDFLVGYSMFIRRYRVNKEAFEYLNAVNDLANYGGGLFDPPVFRLVGNIHKVDEPDVTALGYFATASVSISDSSIFVDGSKINESSFINDEDPACFTTANNLELTEEQIDRPPLQCCDCSLVPGSTAERPASWPNSKK